MAQIGDILAKLGRKEALTTAEQQQIRLWGNRLENESAFVSGLQNGRSNIISADISAERLYVGKEIFSGLAARYEESSLTVQTSTYTGTDAWTKIYADAGFTTAFTTGQDNVVIPETGRYQVFISAIWEANATGLRDSGLSVNDVAQPPQNNIWQPSATATAYLYALDEFDFTRGDEVHVTHWQNSGGPLNVSTRLGLRKLR